MKKTWKAILEDMDELDSQMDQAIETDQTGGPDEGSFGGPSDESEEFGSMDDGDQSMDSSNEPPDMKVEDDDSEDNSNFGLNKNNTDNQGVIDALNQMALPILIMNAHTSESDVRDMNESMSNARVLTEANMVKFDPETQVNQLISITSLLLAKTKQSEKFDAFVKAYKLVKKIKSEILREEESAAKEVAKQFLQKVIDDNSNEDAVQSATKLIDLL